MKSWGKKNDNKTNATVCGFSGHAKYLCIKALQVSWRSEWADIYLKLVSLLMPIWKGGCLLIRVACDLFSMLTWHDVLGIQWSDMNGSVNLKRIKEKRKKKLALQLCAEAGAQIFGLLLPSLTASWLFRWHKMLSLFFLKIFIKSHNVDFWIIGLTLHSCLTVCHQKRPLNQSQFCFCSFSFKALVCA